MKKIIIILAFLMPAILLAQQEIINFDPGVAVSGDSTWATITVTDSIFITKLATSDVKVLSPTSTGGTTSLETKLPSEITIDTILVDFIDVTNNIDVGDTLQVNGTIDGFQSDGTTSLYYHEHNIAALSASPGASGATLTAPSANTLGGYQLDAVGEQLYFYQHVESDWDGATDLTVEVIWEVNEASSADGTVDLQLIAYYKGDLESANKTQTSEVPVTITGNKAQFTQHSTTFTIDWDKTSHVVEVGDVIGFILNLETDTSECDDIIVNHMISRYSTTKPAPQTD